MYKNIGLRSAKGSGLGQTNRQTDKRKIVRLNYTTTGTLVRISNHLSYSTPQLTNSGRFGSGAPLSHTIAKCVSEFVLNIPPTAKFIWKLGND